MTLEEIARGWTPPAGLGYSSMRPVRLAGGGIALVVVAALFGIGAFVGAALLTKQSKREATERTDLDRAGVAADATIIRLWHTGGKSDTPRVRYRFNAGTTEIVSNRNVPRAIWRTLEEGATLQVRYLPETPQINHPVAWEMRVTPSFVPYVVGVPFLLITILMYVMITRQWALLSEGRPAPGIVTKVRRSDKGASVRYEFQPLGGSVQKGRSQVSSRQAPAAGQVVCVLYDPGNPRRNALYPFSLVKLDSR